MGQRGVEGVEDEELAADEGARAREVRGGVEGRGRQGAVACVRARADVQGEAGAAVDVEAVAGVCFEGWGRGGGASSSAAAGSGAAPEGEGVWAWGLRLEGVDCAALVGDGCYGGLAEGAGGVEVEPLEEAVWVVGVEAGVCCCRGWKGFETDWAVLVRRRGC